jgi:protein MpaA
MQRLGKNQGRYHGETIDVEPVQQQIHRAALGRGWQADLFYDEPGRPKLIAYRRLAEPSNFNLYLSSGMHGDEPAGPLAVLRLLEEDSWPRNVSLWLCPCLNPSGLALNTRETAEGIDLNRDYKSLASAEVRAHIAWLARQPRFDLILLLHEDWEANGFYVYELNPENRPSFAEPIIQAVRKVCPIEHAPLIDKLWECREGIIRPHLTPWDRPQWAEAIYLNVHKSPQGYTLESPSDFALELRVRAQVEAVRCVLRTIERRTDHE